MKRSVGTSRSSKGPVRISFLGAANGGSDAQARPSIRMSTTKIPVRTRKSSIDNNPQSAQERKSRSAVKDPSKRQFRGHSAASRTSATPCRINPTGKSAQTPGFSEQRRSQSAHSPYTSNVFGVRAGKIADIRPINEKSFQQQAMVQVYNYFRDQPATFANICPKPGTNVIMIKVFYELMSQLLCKFFPNATINSSNYLTEIPLLMRTLRYPGSVSTSWLRSANTMHAWPHVVAMLHWLVDLSKNTSKTVEEGATVTFMKDTENNIYSPEESFNYCVTLFSPWNDQNEKECNRLDEDFLSALQERSGVHDAEFEAVLQEIEKLEAELNDPVELAAIANEKQHEERCKMLAAKENQLVESIELESRAIEELEQKIVSECNAQAAHAKAKPVLLKQLAETQETIATQKMCKSQVDEIHKEWLAMENEIQQQIQFKENIEKHGYAAMIKSGSLQKKLEKWCMEYNSTILTLGLENPKSVHLDKKALQGGGDMKEWEYTAAAFQNLVQAANDMLESKEEQFHTLESQEQELREEFAKYREDLDNLCVEETSLKNQSKNLAAETSKEGKHCHEVIKSLEAEMQDKLKFGDSCKGLKAQLESATERASQCQKECKEYQEQGMTYLKNIHEYFKMTMEEIQGYMPQEDFEQLKCLLD